MAFKNNNNPIVLLCWDYTNDANVARRRLTKFS